MTLTALTALALSVVSPTKELLLQEYLGTRMSKEDARVALHAIMTHSESNDLDPLLVAAIVYVESYFNPRAVSVVGAQGLMQLMPPTARWISKRIGRPYPGHSFDITDNIAQGAAYYAFLLEYYQGRHAHALTAYNRGPYNTDIILVRFGGRLPLFVQQFYSEKVLQRWLELTLDWIELKERA